VHIPGNERVQGSRIVCSVWSCEAVCKRARRYRTDKWPHRLRFLSDSFTFMCGLKERNDLSDSWEMWNDRIRTEYCHSARPGSQVNSKGFLFSWCWLWEVQNYKVQTSLWSSYLLISYANTELVGSDLMNNQMCLYYTLLALGSWARESFCSNFVLTAKLQFALVCNLQEGI